MSSFTEMAWSLDAMLSDSLPMHSLAFLFAAMRSLKVASL